MMAAKWWSNFPEKIAAAYELSERFGMPLFEDGRPVAYDGPPSPCIPNVGRLLAALAAATKPEGLLGEMGTACGVGCAWMSQGMGADARLISAELDPAMAHAAADLFEDDPRIEIGAGDWHAILPPAGPFDLLFLDSGVREELQPANWGYFTELVKVGGILFMDDLVPMHLRPPEWTGEVDLKREFAFKNSRVQSVEVLSTNLSAALIITRIA